MSIAKSPKATKAHTSLNENVYVAQVRLLYREVHPELIANATIAILLAIIFATGNPHWHIGVWFAYMAVVFAGRTLSIGLKRLIRRMMPCCCGRTDLSGGRF